MSSPESVAPTDQYGLPAGLSSEEAGLYMNGLTQTCAALRRRIAELESDNRILQRASKAAAAAAGGGRGAEAFGSRGRGEAEAEEGMTLMSPSGVGGERGGVSAGEAGVKSGVEGGGRCSSPRSRLSRLSGRPQRASTAPPSSDTDGNGTAASSSVSPGLRRIADDCTIRRVSSAPNRWRHSVGVSRYSLPPNMLPGQHIAAGAEAVGEGSPCDKRGGVWEGLTVTHPLTGDEKSATFMEFAVLGVGPTRLSGSDPLQPWGQDAEVLSGFPATEGELAEAGGGSGDGSFVQGLGDFCFPSGANICLVEAGEGMLEAVPDDRVHLVQFTDCDNASTYGCCVTVTQLVQNPSPRLVKRLQQREKTHASARTLQRFMQRTCLQGGGSRRHGSGATAGWRSATPGRSGGSRARFGFQTPPRGFVDGLAATATTAGAGSAASDGSPTSFSGMINRFFSNNPGAESGMSVVDTVGREGGGGGAGGGAATAAVSGTAMPGTLGVFPGWEALTPPTAGGRKVTAVVAATAVSPTAVESVGATMAEAVVGEEEEGGGGGQSYGEKLSPSPPPGTRKDPYPPLAITPSTAVGNLGSARGRGSGGGNGGGGGGDVKNHGVHENRNSILPGIFSSNGSNAEQGEVLPGIFSDDESETEHSTDQESYGGDTGGDGGGGGRYSGYGRYDGCDETVGEETKRNVVGRDGHVWSQASRSTAGRGDATETSPGLTTRNRMRKRGGGGGAAVAAAAAAVAVAVAPCVTPVPVGPRGGDMGSSARGGGGAKAWAVMMEKCYVMVSCHRNHPVMYKVLKAVADAERSTRPGTAPTPSPPRPRSLPHSGGRGVESGLGSLSPSVGKEGGGGAGGGAAKDSPRSASRFRTVAAAAAEEAKVRHRRMLRDRFLHQVRTDRSCVGEGKKVSIHCPAFLRAPLELTSPSLDLWSTAVLFSSVAEEIILRTLDALLLEKTLVVCGRDLGMVSIVATALLSLLDPFKWEGVFVPVVPLKLMDVLESPVPALVGVQAPFDPVQYAFDGVLVLDLDARQASGQLFMGGMDEKLPVSDDLVMALGKANTLRGRGRGAGAPAGRSPPKRLDSAKEGSPKEPHRGTGGVSAGRRGGTSPGPRSHFAFQASTFLAGLTLEEKTTVLRLRSLVKDHVSRLCGDLGISDMWRKYGAFNSANNTFDFHPDWFTEPLETRLKFQVGVARTQMFVSFVDRCRIRDLRRKPTARRTQAKSILPAADDDEDCKKGTLGAPPPLPSRHCQTPPPERVASPGPKAKGGVGGEGRRAGASLSPPPLPQRRIAVS